MASGDRSKPRAAVATRPRVTANDWLEGIRFGAEFLGAGLLYHQGLFPAFQIA